MSAGSEPVTRAVIVSRSSFVSPTASPPMAKPSKGCGVRKAALSSAVGALSGPLHGGAPAYVKPMLEEVAAMGDAERWVADALANHLRHVHDPL